MTEIDEGLERVSHTRPIPVHLLTRVRFLWQKAAKGDTRQFAALAGVSVRTAQRWVQAVKAGREPAMSPANAKRVEQAVRAAWQPRVRARVRKQAEQRGFTLHVQAYFGYQSAAGSTDDPRERTLTVRLPGDVAQQLFAARDAGAADRTQQQILAEALQLHYFQDRGARARGLVAEINQMNWADFEIF